VRFFDHNAQMSLLAFKLDAEHDLGLAQSIISIGRKSRHIKNVRGTKHASKVCDQTAASSMWQIVDQTSHSINFHAVSNLS
jgi:hypothetical protein